MVQVQGCCEVPEPDWREALGPVLALASVPEVAVEPVQVAVEA